MDLLAAGYVRAYDRMAHGKKSFVCSWRRSKGEGKKLRLFALNLATSQIPVTHTHAREKLARSRTYNPVCRGLFGPKIALVGLLFQVAIVS